MSERTKGLAMLRELRGELDVAIEQVERDMAATEKLLDAARQISVWLDYDMFSTSSAREAYEDFCDAIREATP